MLCLADFSIKWKPPNASSTPCSYQQSRTTCNYGSRNYENHTIIMVFWKNTLGSGKNCGGICPHLIGSLWAFHIWKVKLFLQHFFGKYDPYLRVQKIIFLFAMYFEYVFETLRNSFLFNFFMICIYSILQKIKRTLLKKINILTTLPSRNHGYPVFAGVPVLKVNAYLSYRNAWRAFWFIYRCCGIQCSYKLCVTDKAGWNANQN